MNMELNDDGVSVCVFFLVDNGSRVSIGVWVYYIRSVVGQYWPKSN